MSDLAPLPINQVDLGIQERSLPDELMGQPDRTVSQLGLAIDKMRSTPQFKRLFEHAIPLDKEKYNLLSKLIAVQKSLYEKAGSLFNSLGVHLPLTNSLYRNAVEIIAQNTPNMDSSEIYNTLGEGGIYETFHTANVQSTPVGLEVDFGQIADQANKERLAGVQIPEVIWKIVPESQRDYFRDFWKACQSSFVRVDAKLVDKNAKWRSNDQATRGQIAEKMYNHAKTFLGNNQNVHHATIIEPGGGTGLLSRLTAEQIANDPYTRNKVTILVREYSPKMIEEGRRKLTQINQERQQKGLAKLDVLFIQGSAVEPVTMQLAKVVDLYQQAKTGSQESEIRLKMEYGIPDLRTAEQFMEKLNGTRFIGGMTTYTAGAMSTELSENSLALQIFNQLRQDVEQDGLVSITDFADRPSDRNLDRLDPEEATRIRKMREIYDIYGKVGFSQGLEMMYTLWGGSKDLNGKGHDVRQIWEIQRSFYAHDTDTSKSKTEIDLKLFALQPVSFKKDRENKFLMAAMPGFFQTTVESGGLGTPRVFRLD